MFQPEASIAFLLNHLRWDFIDGAIHGIHQPQYGIGVCNNLKGDSSFIRSGHQAVSYTHLYSMASRYNRVPVPPVVMVKDGKSRVVVRGESLEDLIRNDC